MRAKDFLTIGVTGIEQQRCEERKEGFLSRIWTRMETDFFNEKGESNRCFLDKKDRKKIERRGK